MKRVLGFCLIALFVCMFAVPEPVSAACGVKVVTKQYEGPRSTTPGSYDKPTQCIDEEEVCGEKTSRWSCCFCEETTKKLLGEGQTIVVQRAENGHTYSSCKQTCEIEFPSHTGRIYTQIGAGALPPEAPGQETTAAEVNETLKYCFAISDCASDEYAGSSDAFRPGHGCPAGEGRCVAPEPQINLSYPIGNVQTVAGLRGFIGVVFNYAVAIAAVAAAIMFVYGGMRYIFGSAFQNINRAKEIMIDAAVGLALVLGAMLILRTINPATLELNKLEVFMINKEEVLDEEFCANIQSKKPLSLADAGQAPAFIPIGSLSSKDYTIKPENTQCGYDYYIDGFGESRCKGSVCDGDDEKGTACVSCKSGLCGDEAEKDSYECVKFNIAGTVKHDENRYLDSIRLYAICDKALEAEGTGDVSDGGVKYWGKAGVKSIADGEIIGVREGTGRQSYTIKVNGAVIQKANDECGGSDKIHGFVLGAKYHDVGGTIGAVTKIFAGTDLEPTRDDYAVIGPNNCGSGKFPVYLDGRQLPQEEETSFAVMCGVVVGSKPLRSDDNVWGLVRINKTFGFGGQDDENEPLTCDFELNPTNAASNMAQTGSANKAEFKSSAAAINTYHCGTN